MAANAHGGAVLEVLQQMATYDAIEHESKLAWLIFKHSGPDHKAKPTPEQVMRALLELLEAQAQGQDLCITVQALGDLHSAGADHDFINYDLEEPRTTLERQAVAEAERFAGELASALRAIIFRSEHGISEG